MKKTAPIDDNLSPAELKHHEAIEQGPAPQSALESRLAEVREALAAAGRERRASHGGKRPGAGRPAKAVVKTLLSLTPEGNAALRALAKESGLGLAETASQIFVREEGLIRRKSGRPKADTHR